jgi:hypothetical protein
MKAEKVENSGLEKYNQLRSIGGQLSGAESQLHHADSQNEIGVSSPATVLFEALLHRMIFPNPLLAEMHHCT